MSRPFEEVSPLEIKSPNPQVFRVEIMNEYIIQLVKDFEDRLKFYTPLTQLQAYELLTTLGHVIRRHTLFGGSPCPKSSTQKTETQPTTETSNAQKKPETEVKPPLP